MSRPTAADLYGAMLEDHRLMAGLCGGWVEEADGYTIVCNPAAPDELLNGVWVEPGADGRVVPALDDAVGRLRASGAPPFVVTLGAADVSLADAARGLGLAEVRRLPGMLVMPRELRHAAEPTMTIDRETEPGTAVDLLAEGFGIPREVAAALVTASFRVPDLVDVFVARAGGVPVSTATLVASGDGAGLYGVATPLAHRGKGYGTAVSVHAAARGFERGAGFIYLQASAMGLPIYRSIGFEDGFSFTVFTRPA